MSKDDASAKAAILATLQDPVIKYMGFMVGRYFIGGSHFKPVLEAVQEGKITVKYDPSIGQIASYNHVRNEIELGFKTASLMSLKATIVHECVHAAIDAQPQYFQHITKLASEAAGYIGQCMFVIGNLSPAARLNCQLIGPDAATDKIFRAAWKIALAYYTKGDVSGDDELDLENALRDHPYYGKNLDALNGYDGIHRRAAKPRHAGHRHAH